MSIIKPPWSLKRMLENIAWSLCLSVVVVGIIWFVARLCGFHVANKWLFIAACLGVITKRPIMYLLKH
jgi:hypothetical protein